jgi:hypothetical protein
MSFAVWLMTLRQNRRMALALMPGGRLFASGRWVAKMSDDAEGRAALGDVGADGLQLGAVLLVLERDLALVEADDDRVQSEALVAGQGRGDLRLRAAGLGQLTDHLGAAAQLFLELAHGVQDVQQVLVFLAGPVAVADRFERAEVAGALEVEGEDPGPRVEGGDEEQQTEQERLAHAGHGADDDGDEHQADGDVPHPLVVAERRRA